jgi:heptosyltransferase I
MQPRPHDPVLIVKLSSLGDVVHQFPALTDASKALPHVRFEWVVEAAYVELAQLHPAVAEAIPIRLRRLAKQPFERASWRDVAATRRQLAARRYERIIDTQGLVKSAMVAMFAKGERHGHNRASAREPLASFAYHVCHAISRDQHAVTRNRRLTAAALGYAMPNSLPDYGIAAPTDELPYRSDQPYAVLLHATSRATKEWPFEHWVALGRSLIQSGWRVVLPWGSEAERGRSEALAIELGERASVPPALRLSAAATLLAGAKAVIGVDTGLAHLAVALGRPTVGLYLATDPDKTGLLGAGAVNLGGPGHCPSVDAVLATLAVAQAAAATDGFAEAK